MHLRENDSVVYYLANKKQTDLQHAVVVVEAHFVKLSFTNFKRLQFYFRT